MAGHLNREHATTPLPRASSDEGRAHEWTCVGIVDGTCDAALALWYVSDVGISLSGNL
jgi:hypothetical protein